jgi:hypothetical protein
LFAGAAVVPFIILSPQDAKRSWRTRPPER